MIAFIGRGDDIEKRLANALVLFGPRPDLRQDRVFRSGSLGPLAEKAGHRVVYAASFWQSPLSPVATLLAALGTQGERKRGLAGQLQRLTEGFSPKLKIGWTS